jgi:hypothetical protein
MKESETRFFQKNLVSSFHPGVWLPSHSGYLLGFGPRLGQAVLELTHELHPEVGNKLTIIKSNSFKQNGE